MSSEQLQRSGEPAVAYCQQNGSCPMERPLADCTPGSPDLCSCSELIRLHAIETFDECTQEAAVAYCQQNGSCPIERPLADCTPGSPDLCSCSELIRLHAIE